MSFSKRIIELRQKKGLTQNELADLVQISRSALSLYEIGKRQPDFDTLQRMADFFNVTTDYLLGRTDLLEYQGSTNRNHIPVLGTIRAGLPVLAEDNWEEEIDIPAYLDADFALRVAGDSMSWIGINDGDLVLMEQTSVASHGSIVAAGVEDIEWRATLKFFVQENGGYYLRAANPEYEDMPFTAKHRIIGRLVRVIKEAPSLQDYKTISNARDLYDRYWQDTLELATQKGLDGKKAKKIIEAFVETFNNF